MTPGIALLMLIWAILVLRSIIQPWIGAVSYAGFAVLCPPWNWRWGLPLIDYQKFLAIATLLGWAMAGFQHQKLTTPGRRALFALCAYLAWSYVSMQQSINPIKSALFFDTSWKIVLMTIVAALVVDSPKRLLVFVWALVACQGWNAFNINQLYLTRGFINVNSFTWNYLDNNTYTLSSMPAMAISIALLLTTSSKKAKCLAGFVLVMQLHQIMLLQSRGCMLGGMFMLALAVYFMPKTRKNWQTLIFGFMLGAILAGPPVVDEFMSSFQGEEELDTSAESRYHLWKAGARIIADYPLLGAGPWAGELLVPQYYEGVMEPGLSNKALHNLFFEVGTGIGVPGLLFYLAFFAVPWWDHYSLWRRQRQTFDPVTTTCNLAILCGIPGYWAGSMFSSGALIEAPYMLVAVGIASAAVHQRQRFEAAHVPLIEVHYDDSTDQPLDGELLAT